MTIQFQPRYQLDWIPLAEDDPLYLYIAAKNFEPVDRRVYTTTWGSFVIRYD